MTTIPNEAVQAASYVELGDPNETVQAPWHLQPEEARRVLEAALPTFERQAIQEFIETSGFYLARELSEAACYRQSLGTPCGKQHPHIEVVYGVSEEIVAEYLTRKGASDE